MKKLPFLILLILVTFAVFTEAAFERQWVEARKVALGNSVSNLFPEAYSSSLVRSIVMERSTIPLSELNRNVFALKLVGPKNYLKISLDSFGDPEIIPQLHYLENTLTIGGALNLINDLELGALVKTYNLSSANTAVGFGLDLGVQQKLANNLKIGFEIYNLYNRVSYQTGTIQMGIPIYNMFLQAQPFTSVKLSFKVNQFKEISVGLEYWIIPELSVCLGMDSGEWAGGLGVDKGKWRIEYGFANDTLGLEQVFSIRYYI